jgi:hypothetical protein
MPVSVIRHDDLDVLAETFEGRKLPVARSVYFAVVQLVAESTGAFGEATRKELAQMAGVSVRTLDENVTALEEADLIFRQKRWADGLNLPNLWALGAAPGGGAARGTTPGSRTSAGDDPQHPSTSSGSSSSGSKEVGSGPAALPLPEGVDIPDDLLADAGELLRRKQKVGTQLVRPEEMVIAAAAIAEFNRQADSDFGLGAHVRAVVGRIRERPSYTADAHVRLVQSAFRLKWWEKFGRGGRATPAVIYGNAAVFEQVVQDATDEKKGRAVADTPQRRKRFERQGAAERQD